MDYPCFQQLLDHVLIVKFKLFCRRHCLVDQPELSISGFADNLDQIIFFQFPYFIPASSLADRGPISIGISLFGNRLVSRMELSRRQRLCLSNQLIQELVVQW